MIVVRAFERTDFTQMQDIYQQGIDGGHATFETKTKPWPLWDQATAKAGRLIATQNDQVVGYAYLSDVSSRCVYQGVAETSIYVDTQAQGKGIGLQLLIALVKASELANYWTLEARIFPENIASIRLHEKAGFSTMGCYKKLGQLNGKWRDVQLLQRRSETVGQD